MKVSRWLGLGLILLAVALFWRLGVSPRWQQRVPVGWGQEYNFIGISTLPDLMTGQFPAEDGTGVYQRIFEAIERSATAVTLQDRYIIRDPLTDDITYNYAFSAEVDPMTGAHRNPEYQGDYYVFPREVKKGTYHIRHSYIEGVPVTFQMEEKIEGVESYLFSYRGAAEYTESYAGLQDALGRKTEPGQEVRCADDQFRLDMWVEPITGEILKIDESCYAGDYVFDIASGEALFPVLRWGAVTAGDDVQARSDLIRGQRTSYLWGVYYAPLLLLALGLYSLGFALYHRLANRPPKAQGTQERGAGEEGAIHA